MEIITYVTLNGENFNTNSLDYFIRRQEVKECWRRLYGKDFKTAVSLTLPCMREILYWGLVFEKAAAIKRNGRGRRILPFSIPFER